MKRIRSTKFIKDPVFYKSYFGMFSVVALHSFLVCAVNLADSVMLGRYSELAMSGVSLANQIQFLLFFITNGACNGLVVLGAQYWGKRDPGSIKKVFSAALAVCACVGAVFELALLAAPAGVLRLLSDQTEIVAVGAGYIRIVALSYLIFAVSSVLIALMRSVESVRVGFYTALLALFVNISLNYALIFGCFGFPALGETGAAVATLISRAAELVFLLIYVFCVDKKLRLRPRTFFQPDKTYFRDYIRAGLPLIGSGGSWGVAMTVQTAVVGRLGAVAIGANAVAGPVFQIIAVLYNSSSSASSVLIGKTVGEDDIPRVKRYTKKLQVIFLLTGLFSGALLFSLRYVIVDCFGLSPETRALSLIFLTILSVTVVGSAYEAPALVGIVSGGGETSFVFRNDLIFMWGIVMPLSFLSAFVFHWPVPVTFFILKLDQILKCFVAAVKVNRFRWIRNLTRESVE